jgi:hypothetical protein
MPQYRAVYITLGLMFRHLFSITVFATSVVQAAPCALTERELLGSWESVGNTGFFEQMAFERDGNQHEFNSWRHGRPEISGGQWQLETCKLTILDSSGPAQIFAVESKGKRLVVTSVDRRSTSTFRKIEEKR